MYLSLPSVIFHEKKMIDVRILIKIKLYRQKLSKICLPFDFVIFHFHLIIEIDHWENH